MDGARRRVYEESGRRSSSRRRPHHPQALFLCAESCSRGRRSTSAGGRGGHVVLWCGGDAVAALGAQIGGCRARGRVLKAFGVASSGSQKPDDALARLLPQRGAGRFRCVHSRAGCSGRSRHSSCSARSHRCSVGGTATRRRGVRFGRSSCRPASALQEPTPHLGALGSAS